MQIKMINKKHEDNKNSSTKQKIKSNRQLIKNNSQIQDQVLNFGSEIELNFLEGLNSQMGYLREQKNILSFDQDEWHNIWFLYSNQQGNCSYISTPKHSEYRSAQFLKTIFIQIGLTRTFQNTNV
ncbi:unnamed protein product [Paramecium octaurelia]|uniref:Uncharacterized protein n=1 Tax=Paramecium octaurelia TaxID=43137 RepID=A0A8S1WN06_PAROT|nr:unnamed protein product [Paramecium octaurelia]